MLVLSRKIGETIRIGSDITLVVLDASRGRIKLGFDGPRDVPVRRGESEGVSTNPQELVEPQNLVSVIWNQSPPPLRAYRANASLSNSNQPLS